MATRVLHKADGTPIVPDGMSHRCHFPSGYEDTYPHPTVAVILRNTLGHVALVRRTQNQPVEPGKLVLPGGYLQQGETLSICATKEAVEETGHGIAPGTLHRFAVMDGPTTLPGRQNEHNENVVTVYLAQSAGKVAEHDEEVTDVLWTPPRELPARTEMGFGHYDILGMYLRHESGEVWSLPLYPSEMLPEQLFEPGWVLDDGSVVR